jgi:hypothetical protein
MENKVTKEMVSVEFQRAVPLVYWVHSRSGIQKLVPWIADGQIRTAEHCVFYKIIHYDSNLNHYSLFIM